MSKIWMVLWLKKYKGYDLLVMGFFVILEIKQELEWTVYKMVEDEEIIGDWNAQ